VDKQIEKGTDTNRLGCKFMKVESNKVVGVCWDNKYVRVDNMLMMSRNSLSSINFDQYKGLS